MKHILRNAVTVVLALCVLLSLTACKEKTSEKIPDKDDTKPQTALSGSADDTIAEPSNERAGQAALQRLRECMDGTKQVAAAAYLGYRDENERGGALDDWLWTNVPGLMANMDFLQDIPSDRVLNGDYGDLYCIVPRDENTSLAVNHVVWKSKENGVWPEADEVLYRSEYAEPLLLFVRWEEFQDEPDVEVIAVTDGGVPVTWCPIRNTEGGGTIKIPTGENYEPLLLGFSSFGDVTGFDYGDDGWSAPTDIGLAETTWNCGGWMLELHDSGANMDDTGSAALYYQSEHEQEYQLTCSGTWRMEDDCLRLELSAQDGTAVSGSFPVQIDPSGEHLRIQQDKSSNASLPFFADGADAAELMLSYG